MASQQQKRITNSMILGTLALSAFFLAQGTSRLVAARLLPAPLPSAQDNNTTRRTTIRARSQRRDPTAILRRNIFDSSRGDLTVVPVSPGELGTVEEVATVEEWDPSQPAPLCSGPARLVGTMISPSDTKWSLAMITEGNTQAKLYRIGSSDESGQVLAISSHRVVIRPSDGRPCALAMFDEEAPAPRAKTATRPPSPRASASKNQNTDEGLSPEELDELIEKVSDTKFNVDEELIENILSKQASLMRAARVIPHQENGKTVGVKLYGVRRKSLLGKLGVQNGDMVKTINGFDMSSPDSALEAYARLRDAERLTVSLVRRGKPTTIEYNIE